MHYAGQLTKFKLNRPLSDYEKESVVSQKVRNDCEPEDAFNVIKQNSTFLEVVDMYYGWKGFMFSCATFITVFVGFGLVSFYVMGLNKLENTEKLGQMLSVLVFLTIGFGGIIFCSTYALLKEAFTYTHWPIRFNRKNRMVYVFRHNKAGGVLSVPWDDIVFVISDGKTKKTSYGTFHVAGHVMDKDSVIQDTFTFGFPSSADLLVKQWEYVRRYMEEGPERLPPLIRALPISEKREPYLFGLNRLMWNFAGFLPGWIIFLVPFLISSVGRFICAHTSKIPVWPADVEAQCQISANDPHRRVGDPGGTAIVG
jgi:hypothetical protein